MRKSFQTVSLGTSVNGAERKDHGFYTTGTQPPNTSLQPKLALASLLCWVS